MHPAARSIGAAIGLLVPALALAALFTVIAVILCASARADVTAFRNPIKPNGDQTSRGGKDGPDPWMTYYRGFYYLTYTSQTHVEIRRASTIGELASTTAQTVWPRAGVNEPPARCCEVWAPEFHRLTGPDGTRWYLYYAADDGNLLNHRVNVLESLGDTPLGPYAYKSQLGTGGFAIDPTVFLAPDGHLYAIWAGSGAPNLALEDLYLARMSNPWTLASAPVIISHPQYYWEMIGAPINEGPEALFHAGKLNVVFSASSCENDLYALGRLTVPEHSNLLDPATWRSAKYPDPIFRFSVQTSVYAAGHNGFFTSPDGRQTWLVYHGSAQPGAPVTNGGCNGVRTTRAQPISWNPDGTPNLGVPESLSADLQAPSGDPTLTRQFEDAPVLAGAGPRPTVASDDPAMVGNKYSSFSARAPGDSATYDVREPNIRTYELMVRVRTGPDAPVVRLTVSRPDGSDASTPAAPRDLYRPATAYEEVDFGHVAFRAGRWSFRFTVTGKNPASSGYALALDQVRFATTPGAPGPSPVRRPRAGRRRRGRGCTSRRIFWIRLPRHLRSARASVGPRRLRISRRHHRLSALVDLRGTHHRVVHVNVVGHRSGALVHQTRIYHLCRPR